MWREDFGGDENLQLVPGMCWDLGEDENLRLVYQVRVENISARTKNLRKLHQVCVEGTWWWRKSTDSPPDTKRQIIVRKSAEFEIPPGKCIHFKE